MIVEMLSSCLIEWLTIPFLSYLVLALYLHITLTQQTRSLRVTTTPHRTYNTYVFFMFKCFATL